MGYQLPIQSLDLNMQLMAHFKYSLNSVLCLPMIFSVIACIHKDLNKIEYFILDSINPTDYSGSEISNNRIETIHMYIIYT